MYMQICVLCAFAKLIVGKMQIWILHETPNPMHNQIALSRHTPTESRFNHQKHSRSQLCCCYICRHFHLHLPSHWKPHRKTNKHQSQWKWQLPFNVKWFSQFSRNQRKIWHTFWLMAKMRETLKKKQQPARRIANDLRESNMLITMCGYILYAIFRCLCHFALNVFRINASAMRESE